MVNRRQVLKRIGLGVSTGWMLPSVLSSCQDEDPKPDTKGNATVAIIGGGAAGLYAADILQAKGITVRILEASDRPGGRVKSLRSFDKPTQALFFNPDSPLSSDFPTELGADRIIGTDSLWAQMVNQQKIGTTSFTGNSSNQFFIDGVLRDDVTASADSDFIAAKNFFNNLASHAGNGISVEQAIQAAGLNPRVHRILNAWIGNKYGTSNDRLGLTGIKQGLELLSRNVDELLLTDNPMQDALLSRFSNVSSKVELNTVVKSIQYGGEKVIVSGEVFKDGGVELFSFEISKVIVTVPVSILKAGDITFTPALPSAKSVALSRMEMDASLRVLIDFKQNFWGTSTGYIYGGVQSPEYFNMGVGRSASAKGISVTANGPKAAELSSLGADVVPALLAELDSVYAGKATENVRKDLNDNNIAVVQDWLKEPYIKGGVAYLKPEGSHLDRIALGTPIGGRLFFAGEATDVNGEAGTISGALLSAERVAQEVIDTL